MEESRFAAAAGLLGLMAVHVLASRMRFLDVAPRSRWLSAAGGISVAYVVVHLLPELDAGQEAVESEGLFGVGFLEDHVYLMALVGLATFYGVELASRPRSAAAQATKPTARFWLSIGSFAVYNAVIGYLVVHREDETARSLVLFCVALGVHFVVNDHALRERHAHAYQRFGRWLLVSAIAIGWLAGELTEISEPALALLVAFIAGGVILNVMKEELPEQRQSRFSAFLVGAAAYTVLLQAI